MNLGSACWIYIPPHSSFRVNCDAPTDCRHEKWCLFPSRSPHHHYSASTCSVSVGPRTRALGVTHFQCPRQLNTSYSSKSCGRSLRDSLFVFISHFLYDVLPCFSSLSHQDCLLNILNMTLPGCRIHLSVCHIPKSALL